MIYGNGSIDTTFIYIKGSNKILADAISRLKMLGKSKDI